MKFQEPADDPVGTGHRIIPFDHVAALGDDFSTFDQARQRLIGRKKKKTFKAGDELEVVVARVDPFKQQLDFAPV